MSPFACFLRKLRQKRHLKQKDVAYQLGYEPSYLSALERGDKGPPRQEFVDRLIRGLDLAESEQSELAQVLKASRRHFSLPARASEQEYGLVRELELQLGYLRPDQIYLIRLALRLPHSVCIPESGTSSGLGGLGLKGKGAPKM